MPLVTLAGSNVNVPPLQISEVISVTAGTGFTVNIMVKSVPRQLPDVGVTVKIAV
jgi:hypothetical protein